MLDLHSRRSWRVGANPPTDTTPFFMVVFPLSFTSMGAVYRNTCRATPDGAYPDIRSRTPETERRFPYQDMTSAAALFVAPASIARESCIFCSWLAWVRSTEASFD